MTLMLAQFHLGLGVVLTEALLLALYGLVAGAGGMWIYWKLSPQGKITAAKKEMGEAQRALRAYTGTDGRIVMRLAGRAVVAAGKQLGLVIGPTLLAMLPVLGVMWWIGSKHESAPGASCLASWEVPFMVGLSIAAIAMKMALKIV